MTITNVALLGSKFMGRAHSNAWMSVGKYFPDAGAANLHTVAARNAADSQTPGGGRHGPPIGARPRPIPRSISWMSPLPTMSTPNKRSPPWRQASTSPVRSPSPPIWMAPGRWRLRDQRRRKGVRLVHVPPGAGLALAHRLVKEGALGRIYHSRAAYLQSWGGPDTPLLWRFQGDVAGSGAHGDLNAHIDAVRFITGEEIVTVDGAIEHTFIEERTVLEGAAGGEIAGAGAATSGLTEQEHGR